MSSLYSISGINITAAAINGAESISSNKKSNKQIEENEKSNANNVNTQETIEQKLFQRLKAIAIKLGIIVSDSDTISKLISKIQKRIKELEEKNKNNSDLNAIKSEFESIKQAYHNFLTGNNSLTCGMNILAQNYKASLGLN